MAEGNELIAAAGQFAALMRTVQERSGLSLTALAERLRTSESALSRWCDGRSVPPEYDIVEDFARECDADDATVAELRRLWVLARQAHEGVPPDAAATSGAATSAAEAAPGKPRGTRLIMAASVVVLLVAAGAGTALWSDRDGSSDDAANGQAPPAVDEERLLFAEPCQDLIAFGQEGECVVELQRLLADAGASIDTDGMFGPETQRRVEAFQVVNGLDVDGLVGDGTKEVLYDGETDLGTWSPEQVADRVREVFTEEPDLAVRIAECQSLLDPLHILPNDDATRNWGVFQISDTRLDELGGTPNDALDPEWNIQAGHQLWSENDDFSHWPHCLAEIGEEDTAGEDADAAAGDGEGDG